MSVAKQLTFQGVQSPTLIVSIKILFKSETIDILKKIKINTSMETSSLKNKTY